MPTLTVDNGRMLVLIGGEPYQVDRIAPGLDSWAVQVSRTGDHCHRVAIDLNGRWHCTCDDFHYRGHVRVCKHVSRIRILKDFAEELCR